MPKLRLVTDSACDLPPALLEQYGIRVARHTVRWDGEPPHTGLDINSNQVLERLRGTNAVWPQIEAPDIDDFSQIYRELRDECDGVLSVHTSQKLSDAYANAMVAREAFGPLGQGGPFPVAVVDSQQISMGLGWMLLVLARAAQNGDSLTALASRAARLTESCHVAFFVERTDGLQRGGRGIRAQSGAESATSLRPLLYMDEGQVVVYERTRTRSKARDALYNFVEDFPRIGELAVFHTGAFYDMEHLMTRIGAIYPRDRVLIYQAGPAVTAWLGPDALGIAAIEAEDVGGTEG
jgi:DegV family protein with EDD domain